MKRGLELFGFGPRPAKRIVVNIPEGDNEPIPLTDGSLTGIEANNATEAATEAYIFATNYDNRQKQLSATGKLFRYHFLM
uniref:Uncharacterized protein n=1 Tax=Romanomermis culicivorax TaxID=13658 RepID=A0A915L696_ROMCU